MPRSKTIAGTELRARVALGYFWITRRVAEAEAVFKHARARAPEPAGESDFASLFLSTKRIAEAEPYLQALAQTESVYKLTLADYYLAQRFHEAEQYLVSIVSDRSLANQI